MNYFESLTKLTIEGNEPRVKEVIDKFQQEDVPVNEILHNGSIGAMDAVGEKWKRGEIFFMEVLRAANIVKSVIDGMRPSSFTSKVGFLCNVVIGTVKGDLHDIGKNLVAINALSEQIHSHRFGCGCLSRYFR